MTPVELRKKIVSEAVSWALDTLKLTQTEIGVALKADERTVRRWAAKEVSPKGHHREKLEKLDDLRHLLSEVFQTQAEANQWLYSRVPALYGRTPISQIRRGQIEEVIAALATIESGAFL